MKKIVFVFCLALAIMSCGHTQAIPEPRPEETAAREREAFVESVNLQLERVWAVHALSVPILSCLTDLNLSLKNMLAVEKNEELVLLVDVFIVYTEKYKGMCQDFSDEVKRIHDFLDQHTLEDLSIEERVAFLGYIQRLRVDAINISDMAKPYFDLIERFFLLLQEKGY
jgi:hypothetical protein